MQQQAMKSLILLLCLALVVNARATVNPTAEHLQVLTTLLQEHHHRLTRQVATPLFNDTAAPTTNPTPTNGSEVPPTTVPTTGSNQPACQNALGSVVQTCLVAHGLSIEGLASQAAESNNSINIIRLYTQLAEIYCSDGRCQSDMLKYFEACIESEVR